MQISSNQNQRVGLNKFVPRFENGEKGAGSTGGVFALKSPQKEKKIVPTRVVALIYRKYVFVGHFYMCNSCGIGKRSKCCSNIDVITRHLFTMLFKFH